MSSSSGFTVVVVSAFFSCFFFCVGASTFTSPDAALLTPTAVPFFFASFFASIFAFHLNLRFMILASLPVNPSSALSSNSPIVLFDFGASSPASDCFFFFAFFFFPVDTFAPSDVFFFVFFFPLSSPSPSLVVVVAWTPAFARATSSRAVFGSNTSKLINPSSLDPSMSAFAFTPTAFHPSSSIIHPSGSSSRSSSFIDDARRFDFDFILVRSGGGGANEQTKFRLSFRSSIRSTGQASETKEGFVLYPRRVKRDVVDER